MRRRASRHIVLSRRRRRHALLRGISCRDLVGIGNCSVFCRGAATRGGGGRRWRGRHVCIVDILGRFVTPFVDRGMRRFWGRGCCALAIAPGNADIWVRRCFGFPRGTRRRARRLCSVQVGKFGHQFQPACGTHPLLTRPRRRGHGFRCRGLRPLRVDLIQQPLLRFVEHREQRLAGFGLRLLRVTCGQLKFVEHLLGLSDRKRNELMEPCDRPVVVQSSPRERVFDAGLLQSFAGSICSLERLVEPTLRRVHCAKVHGGLGRRQKSCLGLHFAGVVESTSCFR
mmetsp:Transcript_33298/g.102834  ORF Transcript_33298/g.102834 Transcript_33298/m.102834 type:complete len:284 (-) Transcript_33298:266-1117(-)